MVPVRETAMCLAIAIKQKLQVRCEFRHDQPLELFLPGSPEWIEEHQSSLEVEGAPITLTRHTPVNPDIQ